jgi:hypothetical protein
MTHDHLRILHILIGTAAVLLYWTALLARKGSPWHQRWGKRFFLVLLAVAASVGPLLLLRPGPFDPAYGVQFVYLALCLVTVAMVSWTAIAWKGDLERFRGRLFKGLGAAILLMGLVVMGAGVAGGSMLTVVFSWVGLVYGAAMLRFAFLRSPVHPRWSMIWHLNGVCGLFNAVHGNLLAVLWRWLVEPAAGEGVQLALQVFTVAVALALRLWFGRTRQAPLRLRAVPEREAGGADRVLR